MADVDQDPLAHANEPESGSDAWRRATYRREAELAALQVRTTDIRGTMPKETKGSGKIAQDKPDEIQLEARVEWLETAVESLLKAVQVRPEDKRQMPTATPLAEEADYHDD